MFFRIPRSVITAATLVLSGLTGAHAEGVYVGGSLGRPDYMSTINGIAGSSSGTALNLYGGVEVQPGLAVQGGVFSLGQRADSTGTVKARGLYVEGVGRYEVAPQWSALGSAGLAEARFTSTLGNDTSPALKVGAGVQYDLTREVALRVQYDYYHFTSAYSAKANVGEVSAGVKYGF